ncbi:MAG: hypothetical protein ABJB86_02825 [Bacteroidota bacterium]
MYKVLPVHDDEDLLEVDIFLGDSDGRELFKALKESPNYTGLPVILYAAGNVHHRLCNRRQMFYS